ncbi:hypothetical protein [Thauera sp. 2A1]|nr:hypothetical protein [Thauera sp. 2A1]KAI5914672.1 hypothetical protein GH664_12060 [Thauera sp. 2A1]
MEIRPIVEAPLDDTVIVELAIAAEVRPHAGPGAMFGCSASRSNA